MKSAMIFVLLAVALSCPGSTVLAQPNPSAFDRVQELKLQLIDLDAKEEVAKLQAQQLEESLKPENIAHALAGIGSTRPEELREQRRRQLLIEKKAVDAQLEQLSLKRSQLQTALATAEVQAYQQSASGVPPTANQLRIGSLTPTVLIALMLLAAVIVVVGIFVSLRLRAQAIDRSLR